MKRGKKRGNLMKITSNYQKDCHFQSCSLLIYKIFKNSHNQIYIKSKDRSISAFTFLCHHEICTLISDYQ